MIEHRAREPLFVTRLISRGADGEEAYRFFIGAQEVTDYIARAEAQYPEGNNSSPEPMPEHVTIVLTNTYMVDNYEDDEPDDDDDLPGPDEPDDWDDLGLLNPSEAQALPPVGHGYPHFAGLETHDDGPIIEEPLINF